MFYRLLDWMSLILLIIGGINLGIVGLFNYDPIIGLLANELIIAHTLFFIMGICAIYMSIRLFTGTFSLSSPLLK